MLSSTSAFFFGTIIITYIYIYISKEMTSVRLLPIMGENIYIYIYMYIWNILNLQFILCSTSNHISSLLTNLFNKYGYHFSFHRSMMKEFTIISTPDLCFILFMDVWSKRHDFQFRLFTSEDISQIFPDIRFTILVQNN